MEFSADLIDDRIWLGNLAAMQNTIALENLHVTHILSVIDSELLIDENDSFVRKHIRVHDVETTDLLSEFDSSYEFIDKALAEDPNNNVLIHCLAGVSRSATIACMWLMRRYRLSANEALKRVRLARPIIRPNVSFSAQLYLFEQMNHQFDVDHTLYKEFQFERARATYIDHDTENEGIEKKNNLREQFRQAFTLPYGRATCTVTETYICRQCQRELFTNADILQHTGGLGIFDWFMKYGNDLHMTLPSDKECEQKSFTNCLEWILPQIDTPENAHSNSLKCPQCSAVVGRYNLNGAKCQCGRWVTPAFHFDTDKIEQKAITTMSIKTKNISS